MSEKRITIKQIALDAGVSVATVSRVFNGKNPEKIGPEVRQRVEKVIKKYNYTPSIQAKGLKSGRSSLIGVQLLSMKNPLSNIDMIEAVERHAESLGYSVIIGVSNRDVYREEKSIRIMLDKGCEGILWQPISDNLQESLLKRIITEKCPLVWLGRDYGHGKHGAYNNENLSGQLAAKYLIEKGCRRPAFIGCLGKHPHPQRLVGWRNELACHNISKCLELEIPASAITAAPGFNQDISALLELHRDSMDGAFVSGAVISLSTYLTMKINNISVRNFPIIGHNIVREVAPLVSFPAICPDNRKIGKAAVNILHKLIMKEHVESFYCDPDIINISRSQNNTNKCVQ